MVQGVGQRAQVEPPRGGHLTQRRAMGPPRQAPLDIAPRTSTSEKDLSEVLGLVLTAEQRADLAGRDLAGLEALRAHLKLHRRWPLPVALAGEGVGGEAGRLPQ